MSMTTNDWQKAEIFARKFSEVFVHVPEGDTPKGMEMYISNPLHGLRITKEKIRKVIKI